MMIKVGVVVAAAAMVMAIGCCELPIEAKRGRQILETEVARGKQDPL